jgi:hypothetical protein
LVKAGEARLREQNPFSHSRVAALSFICFAATRLLFQGLHLFGELHPPLPKHSTSGALNLVKRVHFTLETAEGKPFPFDYSFLYLGFSSTLAL